MLCRADSFTLSLELTKSSPNRKRNLSVPQASTCRICLEQCPSVEFCKCKGTSMLHVSCLREYILKGQGTVTNRSKCELCGQSYNISFDRKCKFSCKRGIEYFKKSVLATTLYVLYSILTITYILYCGYMNKVGKLDQNLQMALLIVGSCLALVMLVVGVRWAYIYLFVTVYILMEIRERQDAALEVTENSLNESQQTFK